MAEPTSLSLVSASTLALTTASAISAPIGTANPLQPRYTEPVRLAATAECWFAVTDNPAFVVAVGGADAVLLPAGTAEYVDVPLGHRIAGIVAADTGSLNIARTRKTG